MIRGPLRCGKVVAQHQYVHFLPLKQVPVHFVVVTNEPGHQRSYFQQHPCMLCKPSTTCIARSTCRRGDEGAAWMKGYVAWSDDDLLLQLQSKADTHYRAFGEAADSAGGAANLLLQVPG